MRPILIPSVRPLPAIDRCALSLMTRRATDFIRGMGTIRQKDFPSGMGAEGIGFLFEANAINSHVTGLTSIHSGHRLAEVVTVKFVEYHLLNVGDLEEGNFGNRKIKNRYGSQPEEGGIVHNLDPSIPLGGQLGEFCLELSRTGLDLLLFVFDLFPPLPCLLQHRIDLCLFLV